MRRGPSLGAKLHSILSNTTAFATPVRPRAPARPAPRPARCRARE